jgi:hypothetical protein
MSNTIGVKYFKKKPRKGFTSKHEVQELSCIDQPNRRERRALKREVKKANDGRDLAHTKMLYELKLLD